ncbi:hypothetical protein BGW80DRAFT_1409495, partial [Lactifluus volemus]
HKGVVDLVVWKAMYNKGTKAFDSRNVQSSSISSPKSMTIVGLFPERRDPSSSTTDHRCPTPPFDGVCLSTERVMFTHGAAELASAPPVQLVPSASIRPSSSIWPGSTPGYI